MPCSEDAGGLKNRTFGLEAPAGAFLDIFVPDANFGSGQS